MQITGSPGPLRPICDSADVHGESNDRADEPSLAPFLQRAVITGEKTVRVLFIGEDPESVDFSDPALPPGLTAEKIQAGIEFAMNDMKARGWDAELCVVRPDASAPETVERALSGRHFDCVVIGGGIRIPPKSLLLFEALVNAIHRAAPDTAIAFNTSPENTAAAAARWCE
jgi:hypothetical protein